MAVAANTPAEVLFMNEAFSDVELKIQLGDGYVWRFPAHSAFLSSGSQWMKERIEELGMLSNSTTTTTSTSITFITITFVDITADILLIVLRYLYTGELPSFLHTEALIELLAASVRFQMPSLKSDCERRILANIRVLNVGHVLERSTDLMASGRGSAGLIEACRRLVLRYGQIIFSSDLIQQLSRRNLEYIVASPKLNVIDERVVFDGLWRWGKQCCCKSGLTLTEQNIADCLGDTLEHVRFSELNDDDIPKVVKERYCSPNKQNLCCSPTSSNAPTGESRCNYRQPGDLLHQSSRKLVSAFATPNKSAKVIESPALNDRLMCMQLSFSSGVYLTAIGLDAYSGDTNVGSYVLSVVSERNGVEIHKEKITAWETAPADSEGQDAQTIVSTVLRMSVPLKMNGRSNYSLYLHLEEKASVENYSVDEIDNHDNADKKKWRFPSTCVRRNISPPDDHECHMANHCDQVVSITAVYFIPGADRIW